METTSNKNKRKFLFNYFSNVKSNDTKQLELKFDEKEGGDSSFPTNSRNRPQTKHLSVDKYLHCKTSKNHPGGNKTYSMEVTNKSSFNADSTQKSKLNSYNEKKKDEFFHSKFSKLNDSKLIRIVSKSPINGMNTSNLLHYLRNTKHVKKGLDHIIKDNSCKSTQNKTAAIIGK
jgi:hypothetical protein